MPTYVPSNDIWLCKNVGIIENKHQRYFESKNEQISYFTDRANTIHRDDYSYIKDDRAIRIDVNLEKLRDYDYLVFKNSDFDGRYIFAFIIDMVFKADETTYIYYKVDPYQTRMFDIIWKPSYIEREHCKLWEDNKPVINTIDEGLNYGTDYTNVSSYVMRMFNDVTFAVVCSSVRYESNSGADEFDMGSVNATSTPLNYYIIPMRHKDKGIDYIKVSTSGGADRPFDLETMYGKVLKDERYANTVQSITITPFLPFDITYDSNTNTMSSDDLIFHMNANGFKCWKPRDTTKYKTLEKILPVRKYDPFDKEVESKLLMYPYSYAELSDLSGHKMDIKLEYINTDNVTFTVWSSVSHASKWAVGINGYNTNSNYADYMLSVINNTTHDIPVKQDMLASFMQSNRNAITMTNIMGGLQFLSGVASLATVGGAGLIGGASVIASEGTDMGGMGAMQTMGGLGGITGGLSSILSTQAKIRDIDNIPPSISSMGNNSQFDYGNGLVGFKFTFKQIKPEYKRKLSSIFKMYGYKVNEVKIPNLHTRQSYNYVKTVDAVIQGNMSVPEKVAIMNMFNNGITLWHNNDIGNYDLPNGVI